MKYWDLPAGPMRDAVQAVPFDDFTLIEENGRVNVTNNHWVELELRVIDDEAVSWFRHGNCAALALAIHDVTGWPLAMVAGPDRATLADTWRHVLAQRPDGLLLDITGAHTPERVSTDWQRDVQQGAATVHSLDRAACVAITDDLSAMDPFERAVVEDFAAHLLSRHSVAVPA